MVPNVRNIIINLKYMFVDSYLFVYILTILKNNRIGGVMVSVLVSSAVDRGFESRSGQIKDYTIGIYCFSA
jgi:hypothetical protein